MRLLSFLDPRRFAGPLRRTAEGWHAFWFTPADPTVLGLLRIAAGGVLLYILAASTALIPVLYTPDALVDLDTINLIRRQTPTMVADTRWSSEDGQDQRRPVLHHPELMRSRGNDAYFRTWRVLPPFVYDQGIPLFSHLFHVTDVTWIYALHGLAILVAALFTLGLGSRVITFLAWFVALSYSHRGNLAAFGQDTMLGIVMLYLMIGPSCEALSLGRLIARYRGVGLSPPEPSVSANLALRLFQVHFCIIYFISGASKLQGPAWWNGTALWQTASNYEFAPPQFAFLTEMLRWLCQNRVLWELVHSGGSVFTLALELSLPFLIWYPHWRGFFLVGAVLLHTGIALSMGLTAFSLLMIVIVGSFLPAATVKAFLGRLPAPSFLLRGQNQIANVQPRNRASQPSRN